MPIYEYQCSDCGHSFDAMQKINDNLITECPKCHENTVVRLVSAAGFQLKGTGWYATDFKNKKQNDSTNADKPNKEPSKVEVNSSNSTEGKKN